MALASDEPWREALASDGDQKDRINSIMSAAMMVRANPHVVFLIVGKPRRRKLVDFALLQPPNKREVKHGTTRDNWQCLNEPTFNGSSQKWGNYSRSAPHPGIMTLLYLVLTYLLYLVLAAPDATYPSGRPRTPLTSARARPITAVPHS